MQRGGVLATGLLLGAVADRVLGDPRRFHPVAGFGRVSSWLESRVYADDRARGTGYVAVLVGGSVALGCCVERIVRDPPLAGVVVTAAATWAVLGGRSLAREAESIAASLQAGDIDAARARMPNLVSRDPQALDANGIARATLESVAENTSDAVVAPLLWGAVAGVPGLIGYRAINTLDAMVGYRNERYQRFGWAAARLDDVVNWVPARLAAGLALVAAPLVGGSTRDGWTAVRTQAGQHPSPNGGQVESAFAGVLGVTLGGRNVYGGVEEDRGELGHGPAPKPSDLARANRLALAVSVGAVAISALGALLMPRRPRP